MKVLLLSRYYQLAASSRYRFYQYLPYLEKQGIEITAAPLLDDYYLKSLYAQKTALPFPQLIRAYAARLKTLAQAAAYDVIWLQMEALPWIPHWLEHLFLDGDPPYIVDYDDAWFHTYDQHPSGVMRWMLGQKIDRVMKNAALVVAGNEYIAARAEQAGAKQIAILPTVVDLDAYPLVAPPQNETFTVGWMGTPPTGHHLKSIHEALRQVCQQGDTRVVAIGDESLHLEGVNLQVKPWRKETEVADIQQFDLGIMPLKDSAFERGKCGCKLIQYMAAARPVVATPVGVNQQLIVNGENGFHATTTAQWVEAISKIKRNPRLREQFGVRGRAQVERAYCLQVTAPQMAALLHEAARPSPRAL